MLDVSSIGRLRDVSFGPEDLDGLDLTVVN